MRKFIFLTIVFTGFFTASYSQTSVSGRHLSLEEAVAKALEHNFEIRVSGISLRQAIENNTAGNAGLLPYINGSAGMNIGSSNTKMEFADGRIQEVNNAGTISYTAGVNASYTLFAGGRAWLVRKQLSANESFSRLLLDQQIQTTVSQVIQTYARVVWQQQQSIAIDTGLALAQIRMLLSRVKFETGTSAKVDYLQARVDYNSRQSDSLAQISALNSAFADLNLLMGEDPYKSYIVDDSLELNLNLRPASPELLRETNLSLAAARENLEIARLQTRITRTFLLPSLDLNAGYNFSKTQSQAGFALFNQSFGPSAGLGLNIPVFQGGNLRGQTRVAALEEIRQDILLERQNTEVNRQYKTAWKNYETSLAAYRLEQENIGFAKENLDIQKARFRVGIATTLETREAENSYVQALIRLYTAAYNLKVSEVIVLELESNLMKR